MSSPSLNPVSSSTSQHPETASTMPAATLQTPNGLNAEAVQTTQRSEDLLDDPTQRYSGREAAVTNNRCDEAPRWSLHKCDVETIIPYSLKYYEGRRTGKIEARSFEEWGDPVSPGEAKHLHDIEHSKVQQVFFNVDYNRGFTGRGVEPGAMERPGLVGPRNETMEEVARPVGASGYEHPDRRLWQNIDKKSLGPFETSKDEDDVGPFGETGDDEDVGPFGESRDDEDVGPMGESREDEAVGPGGELRNEIGGLPQDHEDGEQAEEGEDGGEEGEGEEKEEGEDDGREASDIQNSNELMQIAAKSIDMMSGRVADTGAFSCPSTTTTFSTEQQTPPTSSSLPTPPPSRKRRRDSEEDVRDDEPELQQKRRRMEKSVMSGALADTGAASYNTTTTFPSQPQVPLTSSSLPLASTPSTTLGKRAREPEEEANDDESQLRQKRTRMDDILGIVRKPPAATNPQNVGAAMAPDKNQPRKRMRGPDDDSEDCSTKRTPKRLRLFVRPRETGNGVIVEKDTRTDVHTQASVEGEPSANVESGGNGHAVVHDEAARLRKEWDTAYGINSDGHIPVRRMGIYDLTGNWTHGYLSTSRSPCDTPLTEAEMELLRIYIQDYGIKDWTALSQSMNRAVSDLRREYLEFIIARDRQLGRDECAGIPR